MTTEIATSQSATQQQQQTKKDVITTTGTTDNNNNNTIRVPGGDQQQLAALMSDPNFKFPLENSWSFWFFKNDKSKEWKDNVKFITSVDFVEDFWGVYNHLQLVSKVSAGCDYMFFKKGIPPMWEDPQNLDGGRWVLNLDKKHHHTCLDIYWLNLLLALIGEQFDNESDQVNGVWVNVRPKADKIAIWTKSARNSEAQLNIGNKIKEILSLKDQALTYEMHQDDKKQDSGPLYTV